MSVTAACPTIDRSPSNSAARTKQVISTVTVLSSSSGLSVQDLDDDILILQAAIIEIKRHRNQRLPVSRLLPEILSIIFHMCRDEDTEQQDLSHRQHHGINYKPPVHWMKAISACHSWYQIALADKSLWTDIYLPSMSPTAAEMLIERSGSVEIALYYRTNNSGTPYGTRRDGVCRTFIEQAVRTYPDRVGKLYIATDDHSYLSALFSRPLSSLTTLRIINMIPGLGSGMHIDSSTLTRHPSLTSLKLDKYTVTPCCPALDNLTHLKLGYSQWERSPTGQKSIVGTKLNDLLARMVHVRRIELDISGPDRNKSNDTTVRFEDCRIHLPASLEEIVLSERLPSGSYKNGASPVLEFVQRFVPSSPRTRISIGPIREATVTTVASSFSHFHDGFYKGLTLRSTWDLSLPTTVISVGMHRQRWPLVNAHDASSTSRNPLTPEDVTVSWREQAGSDIFTALSTTGGLHLDSIGDLFLQAPLASKSDEVRTKFFRCMASLERLYITEKTLLDVLDALLASVQTGDGPLLPRLESLCIVCGPSNRERQREVDYDRLKKYLLARKVKGMGIKELQIPEQWEGEPWVDDFREVVSVLRYSREGYF